MLMCGPRECLNGLWIKQDCERFRPAGRPPNLSTGDQLGDPYGGLHRGGMTTDNEAEGDEHIRKDDSEAGKSISWARVPYLSQG